MHINTVLYHCHEIYCVGTHSQTDLVTQFLVATVIFVGSNNPSNIADYSKYSIYKLSLLEFFFSIPKFWSMNILCIS